MNLNKEINKLINLIDYLLRFNNNPNYLFSDYEFTDNDIIFTKKTNEYFESDDIKSFRNLLDNYISNMKKSDDYTTNELNEINNFLNKLSQKEFFTHICKEISTETDTFKQFIRTKLFDLTSVGKGNSINNTCAFEHIFLGEFDDNNEKGFHNWIQFYLNKELITKFNFFRKLKFDKLSIVDFGMVYDGKKKNLSSMILGIHPMIEICIYTLIYLYAFKNNLESFKFDFNDSICFQLYTVNGSFRTCYPLIKENTSNHLPSNHLPSNKLESKLADTESKLADTESKLADTESKLADTESKLTETNTKLTETNTKLTETNTKLTETNTKLTETNTKLTETNSKLTETNTKLTETNAKLKKIKLIVSEY